MKMVSTFVCLWLASGAACQQVPPQDPKKEQQQVDPQKVLDEVVQQFKKEGIEVDAKAQTVSVAAFVNTPQDPIEYLLVHRKGKRHEAMFYTRSKPSVLNGALLMLGLTPGKNATYVEKDPPPTLEEIEKGADPIIVTPPEGTTFWMTVKWKTPEGKAVEHCVEDLLLDLSTQLPVVDCSWVFLGGRMARIYKNEPEVYVADFEGNLVSVCYLSPDNHLGTMAHKDARDDQNWWLTNKVPEPETEVQFVFHRQKSKLHVDREARLKKEAAEKQTQKPPVKDGEKDKEQGK